MESSLLVRPRVEGARKPSLVFGGGVGAWLRRMLKMVETMEPMERRGGSMGGVVVMVGGGGY